MIAGRLRRFVDGVPALIARNDRPVRFAIAGGLNTLFGLAFYPLLLGLFPNLRRHYLVALAIAQAVCLVFAFGTYKIGVFRTRANILREFATFSSLYVFAFAANWVALPLLVEGLGLSPIVAQLGFSFLLMIASWFWHSRITFKTKRES